MSPFNTPPPHPPHPTPSCPPASGVPEPRIRADGETMRALREEAERVKVQMNDECDCSGETRNSTWEREPCTRDRSPTREKKPQTRTYQSQEQRQRL